MEKRRVYQVAKEQKLSSDALISMLKDMGYEVKSHMSVVSAEMLEAITRKIQEEKQSSIEEVKRQKAKEESRKQVEAPTAERSAGRSSGGGAPSTGARRNSSAGSAGSGRSGGGGSGRSGGGSAGSGRSSVGPAPVSAVPTPEKEDGARRRNKRRGKREGEPVADVREGLTEKREVTVKAAAVGGSDSDRGRRRGGTKSRRGGGGTTVDAKEVQENLRRTLNQLNEGRVRRRYDRGPREDDGGEVEETKEIRVSEFITLGEFATQLGVKPNEVIAVCLQMGVMTTINQRLDLDTMQTVADEFGYTVQAVEAEEEVDLDDLQADDDDGDPEPRPPVVTVMGHVDHGKTSLLDHLRKSKVAEGESGGITQHIGAYSVSLQGGGSVTFLDTPGHAAFTAMRARGSRVTDLVILVVAADDSVMPQTIEAIDHARAAQVPIVVAINKVDLPTADVPKIKRELADRNVLVEEWGGKVPCIEISAKTGHGMDQLLESLLLEAEILELKAVREKLARGTIIEAKLDKGRGPVATVLIQEGVLREGDPFITGVYSSRVRALLDENGNRVQEAGPSTPVQVLGLPGVPQAGDIFAVTHSEREAKDLSQRRQLIKREQDHRKFRSVTLSDLHDQILQGQIQDLRIIVKGDVDGSVEAIAQELGGITHDEVRVSVIHSGVGAISESDVLLAAASHAVIIGFHVTTDPAVRDVAMREGVEIRNYKVIYEVVEEVRSALSGLLRPTYQEQIVGSAQVRQVFSSSRAGTIAGCMVQNGKITRNNQVRVMRGEEAVFTGGIASLRRFKDDVREVSEGFECGIGMEGFNAIEDGDIIEAIVMVETIRSL